MTGHNPRGHIGVQSKVKLTYEEKIEASVARNENKEDGVTSKKFIEI